MTPDKHDMTAAFHPSIPPVAHPAVEEPLCDCPPGAWHLRTCPVAYWPPWMREEEEDA